MTYRRCPSLPDRPTKLDNLNESFAKNKKLVSATKPSQRASGTLNPCLEWLLALKSKDNTQIQQLDPCCWV